MNKQRAITYSVLSLIRSKGELVEGPIDVFVPLIKRVLSRLNEKETFSGQSIVEIKSLTDSLYGIDFPISVLEKILKKIANEINTGEDVKFIINQDKSFQIKNYTFTEFEESINKQSVEIDNLEKLFKEFCETCNEKIDDTSSILSFIEVNKSSLSKYLAHKIDAKQKDFTVEAQFVNFFRKIPVVYDLIRRIYLGAILASYIEYKTSDIKTEVELLLDTNFILGFLDLNTPEATHTCRKLVEITLGQGYKLRVLKDTLNETQSLLKAKSENFDKSFLQKKVYPEDIYNACERRNLNRADIERISDNLELELNKQNILVIPETTKYTNIAKNSKEYAALKPYRNTPAAALHDATAIHYVRLKRGKKIKDFENVNCWFVNNNITRDKGDYQESVTEFQPELIKADEFLNILWLSNPQINVSMNSSDLADIGITSLISLTLSDNLPKAAVIRELDDNIHKYASEELTDSDVVRIATRITNKQLKEIDALNKLATNDKAEFVKRLELEAKKQAQQDQERISKLDTLIQELSAKDNRFTELKKDLENKSKEYSQKLKEINSSENDKNNKISDLTEQLNREKSQRLIEENKRRKEKRVEYKENIVSQWRRKSIYEFLAGLAVIIVGLLFILYQSDWNFSKANEMARSLQSNFIVGVIIFILGAIFSGITIRTLFNKYRNHSNIKAFTDSIEYPDDMVELINEK